MSADSERAKQVSLARDEVNRSIRRLWLAFSRLEDFGENEFTADEAFVFSYITEHPAVAEKLRDAVGGDEH